MVGTKTKRLIVVEDLDWRTGHASKRRVGVRCLKCETTRDLAASSVRSAGCDTCYRRELAARSLSTAEAVAATGITRQGIHQRVQRGWDRERAQTTPRLAPVNPNARRTAA
jgi:hypothetical protein